MNGMENMHVLIHAWANLCVCVEPALGLFDLQRTSTVHLNIGFNYSPTPMLWLNIICVMVGRARWRHQLYTHSMIGFLPITVPHTHIIFIRPVSIRVLFFFCECIWTTHQTASREWIIVKIIIATLVTVTVRLAIVRLHNKYCQRQWCGVRTKFRQSIIDRNSKMVGFHERHIFIKSCYEYFASLSLRSVIITRYQNIIGIKCSQKNKIKDKQMWSQRTMQFGLFPYLTSDALSVCFNFSFCY